MDDLARADGCLRELALFAGAGGGILGGKLLGWRTVCAVEWDAYASSVLVARQDDGSLEPFPIWDDVGTFDGRGLRGHIDVVSAGFPCQAFSTASRGRAVAADRWPDALRIIREVEPRFVLAENVLRAPIERGANDLQTLGYATSFGPSCPSFIGSPARRRRWWLAAHADGERQSRRAFDEEVARLQAMAGLDWWKDDPRPLGMADGLAHRMDRLRTLGNGQVPRVAATAWRTLSERGPHPQ
jgi:DNA (cytosine-5)-methyltransferase 1